MNKTILLPRNDIEDFACIACDQYVCDKLYWDSLYDETRGKKTALDLILPEAYLESKDLPARLSAISKNAQDYIQNGAFFGHDADIIVERVTAYNRTRTGLMSVICLDNYDYAEGNTALIRASERTIPERVVPRVQIRANSQLELPHILLLSDDSEDGLMRAARKSKGRKLYGGRLNRGGGEICGYAADGRADISDALQRLAEQTTRKYKTPLLFLVGDGNHSLAAAKICAKQNSGVENTALCEIVNLYQDGLAVEPIHRLVDAADAGHFIKLFCAEAKGGEQSELYYNGEAYPVCINSDKIQAITETDLFIDRYIADYGGKADYAHGEKQLKNSGQIGIRMNALAKSEIFGAVVKYGCLPKKCFSLGEPQEKRYYIEARKIQIS